MMHIFGKAVIAAGIAAMPAMAMAQAGATADAATAMAGDPAVVPAAQTAPVCELHVWPAERMGSMTTGLLGGGLLDAAIHANRDSSNRALMATALDSPSQLESLKRVDLLQMLGRKPDTEIIVHDKPLERSTMNKVKTRRAESRSLCYSELIVADVLYMKSTMLGRSLRTLFMFRDFGDDQKIDFEYKAWGGNGLKLFPPNEGEDSIAALDELGSTFRLNFEEYAGNQRKALGSKPRT